MFYQILSWKILETWLIKRFGNITWKIYTEDIAETPTSVYRNARIKPFAGTFSKHFENVAWKLTLKTFKNHLQEYTEAQM